MRILASYYVVARSRAVCLNVQFSDYLELHSDVFPYCTSGRNKNEFIRLHA